MDAGGGAEVDHVVGALDGLGVVLDDDDGVSDVAEVFEGGEELGVVALMQPDAGLIKDVDDADEAAAELGGEADALGFAAGERAGFAREGEVAEADVLQEHEAAAYLLEELGGDLVLHVGELEVREEIQRGGHALAVEIVDAGAADLDSEAFRAEARAVAGGAGLPHGQLQQARADALELGILAAALEVGEDALERRLRGGRAIWCPSASGGRSGRRCI